MTRHQYYHRPGKKSDGRNRSGAPVSTHTPFYDDKGQRSRRRSERGPYVSQRCARPERPLTLLEMDIKMFWVEEHRRHDHLQPADLLAKDIHVEVRSDNGPQFLATRLREFMADNHLGQVFTHPYTPQENGHVESFHSIETCSTPNIGTLRPAGLRIFTEIKTLRQQRILISRRLIRLLNPYTAVIMLLVSFF